jgi:tetratricopeptide (TPR) repeat protein
VTVQLLNKDGNYLWGDTFPQRISDLLTLQSEIVSRIVSKLRIKLREFQEYRLTKDPTNSASAFECYARGRVLYYRRRSGANDSAIAEFRRAIQLDSNYAQAWAGLGDALAQRHGRFGHEYFWTDSALASSQRAIDLDTALADGYKAKAVAYSYRKEYDKAIALLHKAVQISPTYVQAVGNLGANYLSKRDLTNALKWEILSAGFEPSNWIPRQQIGWIYRLLGDHPQAVTTLRQSMEKPGGIQYDTFEHLGYTYVAMGRKKDALRLIEELLDTEEKNTRVYETAGLIAHFAGEPGMAETYFEKSIELNSNYKDDRNTFSPLGLGQIRYTQGNAVEGEIFLSHAMYNFKTDLENGSQSADLPYYIAAVHAIRGERAEALTWIRKAMERNWLDHAMIEFGPYFTRYRNDKEFKEIVALLKSKTERMLKEVSTNR